MVGKAAIISSLCSLFGMSLASAVQCGFLTSQGGEFAFVSLGIAERSGLLKASISKVC